MNIDRSLIFSYLEEDNIQRAYFRVKPLLTSEGDIRQEAVQLWPNEGGLRIVPDRNEQHTFKARMRTLGAYCVVDLRNQPAEAGKIRTNKNFRPDRGEVNQYILYSDTVHALPENTFYQLLDGSNEDFAALAQAAITPLFYIRQEDTLYGPVSKLSPTAPAPAQEAAGRLFEISCPDNVTRTILYFDDAPAKEIAADTAEAPVEKSEAKPAAQAEAAETISEEKPSALPQPEKDQEAESIPIGESLQILDSKQGYAETLKQLDKPVSEGANLLKDQSASASAFAEYHAKPGTLSGTPLVRAPLHIAQQQTKNRTQEVVTNQWYVGKYEAPAQNLPAGAKLHAVDNPIEKACSQLQAAWSRNDARAQLTDFMLSLDGIHLQLENKISGESGTVMQRVLRQRLLDLEAERLTALCELDRANKDLDAYKQELITTLSARIAKETTMLQEDKQLAEAALEKLKAEINTLTLQRDSLLAKVNELQSSALPEMVSRLADDAQMLLPLAGGTPLRMSPVCGKAFDLDELTARLLACFAASGISADKNTAVALLVLLATSPRIGLACATPAAAATLIRNICNAMCWSGSYAHQISSEQRPMVGIRPVDGTPALLVTSLPNYAPVSGTVKITLSRNTASLVRNAAYDVCQWPVLTLPTLPYIPNVKTSQGEPVSAASLTNLTKKVYAADAELDRVLAPILKAAVPLSGAAHQEMYQFIAICAGLMEGGLPAAVDWGIRLWIIPAVEAGSKAAHTIKALLDEYPISQSCLK